MGQVIIFESAQGGIGIIYPVGDVSGAVKDVPSDAISHEIVAKSGISSDRTFRNAWVKNGKKCETDIVAARSIAHDVRRTERAKQLAPLDIEATIPSKAAAAEAARQVIRDNDAVKQANIDAATTEAGLKTALGIG